MKRLTVATLALGALCLIASGFTVRAAADEPTLPPSWSQFAGAWEGNVPSDPSWDYAAKGGQTTLPPYRVSVGMSDGAPRVLLTRFKLQVDWDGTLRFVPVNHWTSKAQVQGDTLTFRISHDDLAPRSEMPRPVDTEWTLELKDGHQGTLRSISSHGFAPGLTAPLAMRRASRDAKSTAEGC